jgi:hypothetical protein
MAIDRDLDHVHKLSIRHRHLIETAAQCGCFYCGAIFRPSEILDWVDGDSPETGVTALCPKCGIDSVLPSPPIDVTPEFLARMQQYYFS